MKASACLNIMLLASSKGRNAALNPKKAFTEKKHALSSYESISGTGSFNQKV